MLQKLLTVQRLCAGSDVRRGSKCEELALSICRPIYPRKPTLLSTVGTAGKCRIRTHLLGRRMSASAGPRHGRETRCAILFA